MKNFYITTAIDYANGTPHLGHAYEKVLSDVIARYRRMRGDSVFFLTGLDEHGQKVQQSARKLGIDPKVLCDKTAAAFHALCKSLLISNDDYIRTTEERHKAVVRELLQRLFDKGEIYKAEYIGFYSVRAEQFVQEKEKVGGEWPEIYGEVIEISEMNYFFKLSLYREWLVDFLKENPDFIFPRFRQKQVLEFLREPINDLCISRPKERLEWGITLPFDEDYVTFVWFDALINYISAVGFGTDRFEENWPVDFHVIGKDILVPSHSVYWPIMLKACGIPMPNSLLVHGWWHLSGEKMSKSTGITIDPMELSEKFGPDAFRYFVTREMNVGQDSDFTMELFISRYTSDLANDLGNLVSRLLNMGNRYCDRLLPASSIEQGPELELKALWEETVADLVKLCDEFQFHTALDRIFTFVRGINRYAEVRAPWKLAKSDDPLDRQKLETSLVTMAESLRLSAAALVPVMPGVAEKIYRLLGLSEIGTWDIELHWGGKLTGKKIGKKTILFPRPQ